MPQPIADRAAAGRRTPWLPCVMGRTKSSVCSNPFPCRAIGRHYRDFHQLDVDEVVATLDSAAAGAGPAR